MYKWSAVTTEVRPAASSRLGCRLRDGRTGIPRPSAELRVPSVVLTFQILLFTFICVTLRSRVKANDIQLTGRSTKTQGGGTMRRSLLMLLFVPTLMHAQPRFFEGFEADTLLPPGWSVWNQAPFYIEPEWNWTVRDTSRIEPLPGLATGRARAHSGSKAIGVSWYAGIDTNGVFHQADAWLITPRITNIQPGEVLRFWATGGTTSYLDSMQVWLSGVDSTPANMQLYLGSIIWPIGSTYGQFSQYTYDLSMAIGADLWVGFRYNQNVAVDGFFVHLDDVAIGLPTSVEPVTTNVPEKFLLKQNYPNPFNPSTTIEFSLPGSGVTTLAVFNALGQKVATLLNEDMSPGTYRTTWNASGMPSGVYFYRLRSGEFIGTKKLILMK
jgi:hypothetical protein